MVGLAQLLRVIRRYGTAAAGVLILWLWYVWNVMMHGKEGTDHSHQMQGLCQYRPTAKNFI